MPPIEKAKCATTDLGKQNEAKLLELFPECARDGGGIDFDALRQCLSSEPIEGNVERYEFTWPGKRAAKAAASSATTKTLRPCRKESKDFDKTGNLYIEGDNLEALKLLQTGYAGRVKMIYIDPPYNTGHDFLYRDRFSLSQDEIDNQSGVFDEDGNRFELNDSAEARYHSNWCSMMYPRLKLARNLLSDDGVIFISIDDNEAANLRKLGDEVFGERQFQGVLVWKTKTAAKGVPTTNMLVTNHDYIFVYAKDGFRFRGEDRDETSFSNPDNDPRGPWKADNMKSTVSTNVFEIVDPNTGNRFTKNWAFSKESIRRMIEEGKIIWPESPEGTPRQKRFLSEMTNATTPLRTLIGEYQSETATNKLKELFDGKKVFDFPKQVPLIQKLVQQGTENDSLVLDFFSGSATTAHAVMALNAEDGGNRKFIMVQLPEVCEPDSEAARAGYANICEIGKERIRRAGKKILDEHPEAKGKLDTGFRVLKLDSPSLVDAGRTVVETKQGELALSRIRDDRSPEDLLFQLLLETRIPLSDSIATAKVGGNAVFFVGGPGEGAPLVACLDPKAKMDSQFFIEVAKLKPGLAFFRDDAFADDSARTNLQQAFRQFSPATSVKVI